SQSVRPTCERDLLRRAPLRGLAELRERLLVEREDEVRLRLHLAVEVVGERRLVEREPRAEQVLLEHRFARNVREPSDQILDELGALAGHSGNVPAREWLSACSPP